MRLKRQEMSSYFIGFCIERETVGTIASFGDSFGLSGYRRVNE